MTLVRVGRAVPGRAGPGRAGPGQVTLGRRGVDAVHDYGVCVRARVRAYVRVPACLRACARV